MAPQNSDTVVGVDGCRAGWCAAMLRPGQPPAIAVFSSLAGMWAFTRSSRLTLVDVPIGLPSTRRDCDTEAKKILGKYNSRVFLTPPRASVHGRDYKEASRICREQAGFRLAKQTWMICPKIKEADDFLATEPAARGVIRECHPEICFWGLAGRVIPENKSTDEGFTARIAILERSLPGVDGLVERSLRQQPRGSLAADDIVDALVAAVTAAAPPEELFTLPGNPTTDERGLCVEMVYRAAKPLSRRT